MEPSQQTQVHESWIETVCDGKPKLTVPVGPRFQTEVPALVMSQAEYLEQTSDSTRFVGTEVWPAGADDQIDDDLIGKGRPKGSCFCEIPESIECSKKHTREKKVQLNSDLGGAFGTWKFGDMGEDVSELWTEEDQRKFQGIVKIHAKGIGQSLIHSALQEIPSKSRENIINYYFNVHIPQKMRKQSKLGVSRIGTDDEAEEDVRPPPKGSRKRSLKTYLKG